MKNSLTEISRCFCAIDSAVARRRGAAFTASTLSTDLSRSSVSTGAAASNFPRDAAFASAVSPAANRLGSTVFVRFVFAGLPDDVPALDTTTRAFFELVPRDLIDRPPLFDVELGAAPPDTAPVAFGRFSASGFDRLAGAACSNSVWAEFDGSAVAAPTPAFDAPGFGAAGFAARGFEAADFV